ncbi:hypothetical protein ABFV99_13995 [Cytobacillus horneckiae]|uniref:hypothetical protein n=1 Tax=Cytobacillus horneckiae TaxID=549687 RepID=UPI0034CD5251
MSNLKVIIKPSHAPFTPDDKLQKLLDKVGVPLFSLEGRTNPKYIKFIEEHSKDGIHLSKDFYSYLVIREVNTARPWLIDEYDAAEYVQYVDYEIVNPEFNFVKMIGE